MKTSIINSEFKIEPLTVNGLDVYNKYNTWFIDENKKHAYLSLPGICVSICFYPNETWLNTQFCDKFVADIEYDYKNPDLIDSFDFVEHSGTYRKLLFLKSLNQAIEATELFINSEFEGVKNRITKKIITTKKITIKEMAKKAFLHNYSTFQNLLKTDFRRVALKKDKELYKLYLSYVEHNENRKNAELKYVNKLKSVFKTAFGFDLTTCLYQFQFFITGFNKKTNNRKLTDREIRIVKKVMKYYNH